MPDAFLLLAALACTVIGMGWLALAMDIHWNQVRVQRRSRRIVVVLRVLGTISLVVSLTLCLLADTATMAALVWMMLLGVAAITIALVLSNHPRILAPLVAWAGSTSGE